MKSNIKKIFILIIILFIIGIILLFLSNSNNKVVIENAKKVVDEWYIPLGKESFINIYYNEKENYTIAIKDGEDNSFINDDYKLINTYSCNISSCKSYGFNDEKEEVIIMDDNYVIYDYIKNKALKLELPLATYNSIDFLSYEGKDYGLSISNINNMYAFYSLKDKKMTTDFIYNNIHISEKAGLAKGNISVSINQNENNNKYYIVSYKTGEIKKESDVFLGSFGNGNNVYYYENFSDTLGYDAILYNFNFKKIINDERHSDFSVTKSGNLIVKKTNNLYYVYNKDGSLIKKSKEYKNILLLLNDYTIVIDVDDYLKILDIDGNVLVKFIKMNDTLIFDKINSGWYKKEEGKGIYLFVYDKTVDSNINQKKYYYFPDSKKKGIIESIVEN